MTQAEAERGARQLLMNGITHHSYEDERSTCKMLFSLERKAFTQLLGTGILKAIMLHYSEILGPDRKRGLRNSLICLITPLCRLAIDKGADVELCFALSDFYINHLESLSKENELMELAAQIVTHYYDLAQGAARRNYSKPIASAVRYIDRNLYAPCPVSDVSAHTGLEQHYFSGLFSKEVGIPPSQYILRRKLEESRYLLSQLGASVTGVADALCFCDTAHFSNCFKKAYGIAPSLMSRTDMPRNWCADTHAATAKPAQKR
jgi:AraC-like DNA-binding protein